MEDGDKVSDYFNKILTLTNQMKSCGEKLNDVSIMEKIMRSLPKRFDFIVVAIEESKDQEKIKNRRALELFRGSRDAAS